MSTQITVLSIVPSYLELQVIHSFSGTSNLLTTISNITDEIGSEGFNAAMQYLSNQLEDSIKVSPLYIVPDSSRSNTWVANPLDVTTYQLITTFNITDATIKLIASLNSNSQGQDLENEKIAASETAINNYKNQFYIV